MRVAIDKNVIKEIKKIDEFDFIYLFEDEPLEELLNLNIHCIHKDFIDDVEVNLTNYNIPCLIKSNVKDKEWKKPIKRKDYKFVIIVPNCNNDHRRI